MDSTAPDAFVRARGIEKTVKYLDEEKYIYM
jgi:hypothetical protein